VRASNAGCRFCNRGSIARQVAVSLGLGLGFLVAIALIERSLMAEFQNNIQADAPAYYFLDIDAKDLGAFRDTAKSVEPNAKLADAPMLRGRIVAVNGVPAEKVQAAPDSRWVLSSDRGLTYTDTLPEGSTIVEGTWWEPGYSGPPLVSFDAELAKGLGLKLGDPITVNILGRNVEATIASLRKIDWESLAINFVMVFSPNTLEGAPHRMLTTLAVLRERERFGGYVHIKLLPGAEPAQVDEAARLASRELLVRVPGIGPLADSTLPRSAPSSTRRAVPSRASPTRAPGERARHRSSRSCRVSR